MKNRFLVKAITIAFLTGQGDALNAQIWEQFYNFFDKSEYVPQVIQSTDKGFVIVGSTRDSASAQHGILLKTDEMGVEEWRTDWSPDYDNYGTSVVEADDGGFVVVGTDRFTFGIEDIGVRKFDEDGGLVWEQVIDVSGIGNWGAYICKVGSNHYMVCGHTSLSNSNIVLSKLDDSGNILWTKEYNSTGDYIRGKVVKPTVDGGFIVFGERSYPTDDFVFLKTDQNGEEQWKYFLNAPNPDGGTNEAQNVFETPDGAFIATGGYGVGTVSRTSWVMKLDGEGNFLWEKEVGYEPGEILNPDNSTFTLDGKLAILGMSEDKTVILKTDLDGKVLWTKEVVDDGHYFPKTIAQTYDGCFVISGAKRLGPVSSDNDIFLLKTDSIGVFVFDYERIENLNIDFSIYPNPIKDWAVLDITGMGLFASVRFKLYGLNGREVYAKNLTTNPTTIQFPSDLPIGAYVGVLEVGGKKQIGRIVYLE